MVLSCVVCCVLRGVRLPRDVTAAGNQKVALVSTSAEILAVSLAVSLKMNGKCVSPQRF